MSAPIPLRRDFGASQLRGLAKKTKDGPQARRLLALAAIYDAAFANCGLAVAHLRGGYGHSQPIHSITSPASARLEATQMAKSRTEQRCKP